MPLMPPLSPESIEQLVALAAPRRYTAAEARELAAKATPGPYVCDADPINGMVWVRAPSESALADVTGERKAATGALFATAPDLAASVVALEAERDALRALVVAYGQAHDARTAHSKRADSGAELWFAERDELNNAVSDALAALREAAK